MYPHWDIIAKFVRNFVKLKMPLLFIADVISILEINK